jgi:hypothetical protein
MRRMGEPLRSIAVEHCRPYLDPLCVTSATASQTGRELIRLGFHSWSFHTSLIGVPARAGPTENGEIEPVTTVEVMEDYLEAYVAGWGGLDLRLGRRRGRPL